MNRPRAIPTSLRGDLRTIALVVLAILLILVVLPFALGAAGR
jgi:hypothetical protein